MVTAILFHDRDTEARAAGRDGHRQHVRNHLPQVVASGGLTSDDGARMCGGLTILRCDRRAAEAYVEADPFVPAGVYADPEILSCRLSPDSAALSDDPWRASTEDLPYAVVLRGADAIKPPLLAERDAYRKTFADRIVISAAIEPAQGEAGEICIFDTADRDEALRFAMNDPLVANGAWRLSFLSRWRRAYLYGRSFT